MRRWRWFAFVAASSVISCSSEQIGPPKSPAPAVAQATDAIPSDLDVVVRLDMQRIRQALGNDALGELKSRALSEVTSSDKETERLVADAITRADVLVVGIRPGKSAELTDNVLALSGAFGDISLRRYTTLPAFESGGDLGGAFRLYTRLTPKSRSAPARIYTRADELMIFVSAAEIDSVERQVERGLVDPKPEPLAKGLISVAARPGPLAESIRQRSPAAAEMLARSKKLHALFDLNASGLLAELELEFEFEEEAHRAADAAGLLGRELAKQPGITGEFARAVRVEAVGSTVVVRLPLNGRDLARLSACARDASACS